MKKFKVFIDGQSGTTGLQVTQRLQTHEDIQLLSIDSADRKNPVAKKKLIYESDLTILCLPDHAIKESVQIALEAGTRIIDAGSLNRVRNGWTYGLPEITPIQRKVIKNSRLVANPGCYATGAILILKPLISKGFLKASSSISIFGVSGYSGGGKPMVEHYNETASPPAFSLYGLPLNHKHIPEIQKWSELKTRPIFIPSVVNCDQGMEVIITLDSTQLTLSPPDLKALLTSYYKSEDLIRVIDDLGSSSFLHIEGLKNSCYCEISFSEQDGQYLIVARLDNLGKGASGAAVQNLNIMLDLPEHTSIHLP